MNKAELIAFEDDIEREFAVGNIRGPIHLSGGNEDQLIHIFERIHPDDWVFSTWRNHYHALLHGVPADILRVEILQGRNMNFSSAKHRFFTSAIVGGILPIATGVAHALKMRGLNEKVWCFVGDMTATTGIYHESVSYSTHHALPIKFITEDNGFSSNTPTSKCWGPFISHVTHSYKYERTKAHAGVGYWVNVKYGGT